MEAGFYVEAEARNSKYQILNFVNVYKIETLQLDEK
jgi:hypothetical protein